MFQTEYDLGPDVMTYQALAVGCVKQKQGLDLLEEMSVSIPVFLLHMVTSGPLYLSLCHFLSCLICHIIPMHYCSCLPCLTLPCPALPHPALPSPPLPSPLFLFSCLLISTLLSFNNFVSAFPLVYWIKSKHSCLWNISCTSSKKRRLWIPH